MLTKLIRRVHMYLALFLTPWVLLYAISTLEMNHNAWIQRTFQPAQATFEKESEIAVPPGPHDADAILALVHMEGSHNTQKPAPDGRFTIVRNDPLTPRRLTYIPGENKVVVEKQALHTVPFLQRMHRRRGYETGYALDSVWAVLVDSVVVAMVFWVLSGLWMWWTIPPTRALGALAAVSGIVLFAWFLHVL